MIPYAACRLLRGPCPPPPPPPLETLLPELGIFLASLTFWLAVFWLSGLGRSPMKTNVWIAEDNPGVAKAIVAHLEAHGANVVLTDDPAVARQWLLNPPGPIVLDGSVWEETGIGLWDLPEQTVIFTGDEELVARARRVGLRAFVKGLFDDADAFLASLGLEAPTPAPAPAE